jgi:copper(I)-binding protein
MWQPGGPAADGPRPADPPRSSDDLTLRSSKSGLGDVFLAAPGGTRASGMEPSMKPNSVVFALAACLLATGAAAQQYKLGAIEIDHPWSRATPKGAKIGAGYVSIKNAGSIADRLVGGSFADAGKVELHQMTMDQGVMKMRPVAGGLEIKPGETVELKPDGLHLMFIDLKQPLKKGEQVDGTLEFEKAGTVQVQYTVGGVGEKASKPDMKSTPAMKDMR